MAMNTAPVFGAAPMVNWDAAGALTAANTNMDGTGTLQTVFTAGADGAFLEKIVARTAGTNVASVLRIFVNNGGSNAVAANNKLVAEMSLPATTATSAAAQQDYEKIMNLRVPGGYRVMVCIGTAVAAGWHISGHGASYTA
jgi:hypothetical protein